jgi:hypothetical protein
VVRQGTSARHVAAAGADAIGVIADFDADGVPPAVFLSAGRIAQIWRLSDCAGGLVFLSFCYVMLRRVLQLASLRLRSDDLKELEIVVLRHELAILRRRIRRPAMTWTDRLFLAAASRLLPRTRWRSFIITPGTLLR